eukprot:gene63534-biopygen46393
MIKLLGLLLVGVGFAFRVNPLLVVSVAGLTTGLVAGFSPHEVVTMIGQFFVDNRGLTLPITVEIDGHVGYYCAGMNSEATVVVKGNAGVGVAENMMSGEVRVHGDASQAAGATGNCGRNGQRYTIRTVDIEPDAAVPATSAEIRGTAASAADAAREIDRQGSEIARAGDHRAIAAGATATTAASASARATCIPACAR